MTEQKTRTTKRDWEKVKRRIVDQLLALPEGRFPSKRINSLNDIILPPIENK